MVRLRLQPIQCSSRKKKTERTVGLHGGEARQYAEKNAKAELPAEQNKSARHSGDGPAVL